MKKLGKCNSCGAHQVVRTEHLSPNGQHNCGICGKAGVIFAIILIFIGLGFATNITTGCDWIGWDSIQACNAFTFNVSYVYTNITNITTITNITNISNITPGHVNTIEVLSVLFAIILILFIAAQLAEMKILGVFAALLLVLIGVIIYTDGIVYHVGTITGGSNTVLKGAATNSTGNSSYLNETAVTYLNESATNQYAYMSVPYVDFGQVVGLVCILLGIFGMLHYGLGVGKFLNESR